uniref:Perforin 1 n=2 Tax=Latimeria chalumnae TaxID=7897 RepID=H2ZXQ6_LATCH
RAACVVLSVSPVLLLFLHGVAAHCFTGLYEECESADFIPGHNLGGEGFDITTLARKGAYIFQVDVALRKNETCTLCRNRLLGNKVQRLPPPVLDWHVRPRCSNKVRSSIYETSTAFATTASSLVNNNWRAGLGVMPVPGVNTEVVLSGSHSRMSEYAMGKAKSDKYSFSSQEVSCSYYGYRLSRHAALKPQFSFDLKLLPPVYNFSSKAEYHQLIDIYGTHYIKQVWLGGRVKEVTALRTCELAINALTEDEVKDCLGVEASVNIVHRVRISSGYNKCKEVKKKHLSNSNFSEKFNEREVEVIGGGSADVTELLFPSGDKKDSFKNWIHSLKSMPDVVHYSLAPLHLLVRLPGPTKDSLKRAITEYIEQRAVQKTCSQCPSGSYRSQRQKCTCVCMANDVLAPSCCPKQRGVGRLTVLIKQGKGLWGDTFTRTDGYVKVFFGKEEQRTPVISNNNHPVWNRQVEFGTVNLLLGSTLRVEVWDQDRGWDDDKLGACEKPVKATSAWQEHLCYLNHGSVVFAVLLTCAPHLGGELCSNYHAPTRQNEDTPSKPKGTS